MLRDLPERLSGGATIKKKNDKKPNNPARSRHGEAQSAVAIQLGDNIFKSSSPTS